MYKSKLQELCQRRSWDLPDYTTAKDGPDHMPRFTATVTVNGELFQTPVDCKSSKDAQNTAARIAFDHFTAPPPPVASSDPSPPLAGIPNVPLQTPVHYKSSKDAQNTAARVAFDHFTAPPPPPVVSSDPSPPLAGIPNVPLPVAPPVAPPPQIQPLAVAADPPPLPLSPLPTSLPNPPPGLLATKYNANTIPAKEEVLQENCDNTSQCPMAIDNKNAIGSKCKEILHMYKNLLQQHAQKESIGFPVYTSEAEGPPHARRFKSKVSVNGKSYETVEFFPTLKEAEQTAARIACKALSVDVIQEDKGLYKNLLQELAQKKGLMCPSYETVSSGLSHKPIFVSTVEIGSDSFQGFEAKTRKQAEMNAAEVAYYTLTKGGPPTDSLKISSMNRYPVADNLSQNIQPSATEKHQVATDEDGPLNVKRPKSSPEKVDVKAHVYSNPPPTAENQTRWKTVVFPRKSNWSIPENASVMPYSNDQWVAYRVEVDQKPTAEPNTNLV